MSEFNEGKISAELRELFRDGNTWELGIVGILKEQGEQDVTLTERELTSGGAA